MPADQQPANLIESRRLRIAVIGAGIAGLSAAQALKEHNHKVVVFEKSRGPGGRAATRRRGVKRFNHGAQFFTAHDARMAHHLDSWQHDGVIEPWPRALVRFSNGVPGLVNDKPRYRGVGGMNRLCQHLAEDLEMRTQCCVKTIQRADAQWRLSVEGERNTAPDNDFDALLISAPAAQAAILLDGVHHVFAARAAAVIFTPCWAVMVETKGKPNGGWQAAVVDDSPLAWAAINATDSGTTTWTLHASEAWSEAHLEQDDESVCQYLVKAFQALTGLAIVANSAVAHRWRYARVQNPLGKQCLYDDQQWLGVCGDWCGDGSRVESAWLTGQAVADRLLAGAASNP